MGTMGYDDYDDDEDDDLEEELERKVITCISICNNMMLTSTPFFIYFH